MPIQNQYIISADELFGFLFPNECGKEHIAMLYHAYIDDSADRDRERVIVAGAIIGDKQRWDFFNKRWRERLKQDGLEYFKSSQCDNLNKEFKKFLKEFGMEEGRKRAALVRDDLDKIIHASQLMVLGVALSVPFHKVMREDSAKFGEIPAVPYRLAFQQLLAECAKAMILMGRGNIVTFGHDNGNDFAALHEIYLEFKKSNRRYQRVMADFVPLDDKLHPPVQAADVAAWVTRKYAEAYAANPTYDNMKRLRSSMYKIVNWLDNPVPGKTPDFTTGESVAKAVYVS
jgi:Protein of unknown function (DUF3800)